MIRYEKECLVCMEKIDNNLLSCKCLICKECIYEWVKEQNMSTLNLDCIFLTCPNSNCKSNISLEWIENNLPKDKFANLNEILLKKYLNSQTDIKKCPKVACRFAFYVTEECSERNTNLIYKCNVCSFEWKENIKIDYKKEDLYTIIRYYFIALELIRKLFNNLSEELSEIRVAMLCKPCIYCKRNIYRYIGCKHMTCVCKEQFCYLCLQPWLDHLEIICQFKNELIGFTIIHFVFSLFLKLVFSFNFICAMFKYIFYALFLQMVSFVTLVGMIILFGIYIYLVFMAFKNKPILISSYWKSYYTGLIAIFLIVAKLSIDLLMYAYDNYYWFSLSLKIIGYEILSLFTIAFSIFIFKLIKKLLPVDFP